MFERFTAEAREIVVSAQERARALGHRHIGTEHLLLGLVDRPASLSGTLLAEHGLDRAAVERAVLAQTEAASDDSGPDIDEQALGAIGIDLGAVRDKVEATFGPGALDRPVELPGKRRGVAGHIPFTKRAKKVLELSLREAIRLGHRYIGDGHLLLALLRERAGLGCRIIVAAGIDVGELRAELEARIPADPAAATG